MVNEFPVEPYNNSTILKPNNLPFKFYYGMSAWGRTEWIGKLYPEGTKEANFLHFYVQHFNSIELHATHYKIPATERIKNWADKAEGRDFIFCPKVPQSISHYSSFVNIEERSNAFINSIRAFDKHLGPVYMKVSEKFTPKRKEGLYNYLKTLPNDLQVFLEVTHSDWFEEDEFENFLFFLRKNNIGLIILDHPERPIRLDLTIPKCYIRFIPTGERKRVKSWFDKIQDWKQKGLKEAYFFVQPETNPVHALADAQYFQELNNEQN